ncbi:MAG TPA: hypothetical protein VMH81_13930 [Bryobacteraceae bacterium]|nr:hypothetical protein [Bryobacteraceae bacterium]
MNPLNDDQLDDLLGQAKAEQPQPSPAFSERVMRAYEEQTGRRASHRSHGPGTGADPVAPFRLRKLLAAAALILIGALADRTLQASHLLGNPRSADPATVVERVVYQDCPVPSSGPGLTFNELQPVREIKPRVVRSMQDDQ